MGRERARSTIARAKALDPDLPQLKRASIAQRIGKQLEPLRKPAAAIRGARSQLLARHSAGMQKLAAKAAERIAVKRVALKQASVIGTKIPKALGIGAAAVRSGTRIAAGKVAGKIFAQATKRLIPGIGTVYAAVDSAYNVGRATVEGVKAIQAERERRDLETKVREKIKTGAYRAKAVPLSRL